MASSAEPDTPETWSPTAGSAYPGAGKSMTSATAVAEPNGGILRRGARPSSSGRSQTHPRVAAEVTEQSAQRIGTLAILTAVTVVGVAIVQYALQPEMAVAQETPLYRLSALFLVLAAIGLAGLQRSGLVSCQTLLDLGLVLEIGGAFALALMENSLAWRDSAVRGFTGVATWLAICAVVIPNQRWKSITAAILSAAMVPVAHLVAASVIGYAPLTASRLAVYALGPAVIAAWAPFISMRIRKMQEDLTRAQELGSYHLEKLLGRGGMGEVWLARHRLLRRDAAVKLVLPGLLERRAATEQREFQRRFELEAQAIASLRSPHTVAIYDFGLSENGSLYYAMEFLEGLDVETLVERYGAQPPGRAISLLRQACESLEEAHDTGLVHRDVKPSNLFMCRLGNRADFLKLLDFGLVKTLAQPEQTMPTTRGETSGTPAFMPPEQARGDDVDARADIYRLGCVAYFLLTGKVVFERPSAMATALSHITDQPERPSKRSELPIPESLERVVMACLEKRREDRPQSAADLAAMLSACTDVPPWSQADANRWWRLNRPEPVRKASG